ncbi:MAG: hypothetical protein GYA29_02485 [Methanothrix sp.]|nr:hypothetical protein [Methanothrix sp.]
MVASGKTDLCPNISAVHGKAIGSREALKRVLDAIQESRQAVAVNLGMDR